jgi:flagellar biosynthesis protein FliP
MSLTRLGNRVERAEAIALPIKILMFLLIDGWNR